MRFSVDGWDPSYGASLELEAQLAESTARVEADVELPADRWRPVDPDDSGPLPDALLFVDGVRRVEAQVWVDGDVPPGDPAAGDAPGGAGPGDPPGTVPGEPTAALCASYAAGVVLLRRRAPGGGRAAPRPVLGRAERDRHPHPGRRLHRAPREGRAGSPVMTALSESLQCRLGEVEVDVAKAARGAAGPGDAGPAGHRQATRQAATATC